MSKEQRALGWTQRLRSDSMNALFGFSEDAPSLSEIAGHSWSEGGSYRQFLKQGQCPDPSGTWLTVDEHPDSINDGFFTVGLGATQWGDAPASYHNGACGFSFADGHAEIHRWLSATSIIPVTASTTRGLVVRPFDAKGKLDYQWYKDHTGYVLYR
jgi:prepilin-type processing-associated H-X9-DG protein